MKITFSNLGTIKKTELDLRPLTVIIGPNNSSKTYVAYSTYGLWHSIEALRPSNQVLNIKASKTHVSFAIDVSFLAIVNANLRVHAKAFQKNLGVFFRDSSGRLFANTLLDVQASREEVRGAAERLISELGGTLRGDVAKIPLKKGPFGKDPAPALLANGFVWRVERALFQSPFLLPVERNAFVMTYKVLSDRRYKLLKENQLSLFEGLPRESAERKLDLMKEQGGIRYPKPIEDFLDFLTDIDLLDDIDLREKSAFGALADEIDASIHGSSKIRFKSTMLGGREIKIDVKRGLTIDLYNASSSIKQLTPLLLYLRYRARPNDFLIIDEPEMNLHPKSQAKLLEVLGILVNLGVRVLLTTHSPYFMSHLNNLVAGDTSRPEVLKKQAASLYLKDPRAFLPMDQVSAYEMRDNELCSLKDEDYGIRWDTLSDVSSEIQQKFFEIYEKGRTSRGKP